VLQILIAKIQEGYLVVNANLILSVVVWTVVRMDYALESHTRTHVLWILNAGLVFSVIKTMEFARKLRLKEVNARQILNA